MDNNDFYKKYLDDSVRDLREDVVELKGLVIEIKTKQEIFEQLSAKRHKILSLSLSAIALVISFARLYG